MALQHWRGPRAHSNRYEGWDRDSNLQVSTNQIQIKCEGEGEYPQFIMPST